MSGLNKVILIGRLGRDPDIHVTQSGKKCAFFSIATSETWVQNGNKEEKTEWHKIIAWEKLAELAEKFLKKGNNIFIEGKLQTRKYKDKNGLDCNTTEIIANQFCFLETAKNEDNKENKTHLNRPMDDDIPF
nr:hypothetical protein GTC16762_33760 [Pigmentibacter ruber]